MYAKGDIVLIPFPFTDVSGSKVRPAVVLHSATKSTDIVVVFITSQTSKRSQFQVAIEPTKENGVKLSSVIVCNKIATLNISIVLCELGVSGTKIVESIDCELRKVFAL